MTIAGFTQFLIINVGTLVSFVLYYLGFLVLNYLSSCEILRQYWLFKDYLVIYNRSPVIMNLERLVRDHHRLRKNLNWQLDTLTLALATRYDMLYIHY